MSILSKTVFLFLLLILVIVLFSNSQIASYKKQKISTLYNCRDLALFLPVEKRESKQTVILLGDSRIKYWGLPNLGDSYAVTNWGVSGLTSFEILCMLQATSLPRQVIYVLQIGINDLVAISLLHKNEQKKMYQQTVDNMLEIVSLLESTNSFVIWATVVPPISPGHVRSLVWGSGIGTDAQSLSEKILQYDSPNVMIIDMKDIFYNQFNKEWRSDFATDALHWNQIGYDILTSTTRDVLNSLTENNHVN